MSLTAHLDEKDDGQVFVSWTLNSFFCIHIYMQVKVFPVRQKNKKFVRSMAGFFPGLSWGLDSSRFFCSIFLFRCLAPTRYVFMHFGLFSV